VCVLCVSPCGQDGPVGRGYYLSREIVDPGVIWRGCWGSEAYGAGRLIRGGVAGSAAEKQGVGLVVRGQALRHGPSQSYGGRQDRKYLKMQ
jgi:hypothetical protein